MGFSLKAKKKIYVSSVVYNLAGDEEKRPNYLKSTVMGKIIADTNPSQSMANAIQNSYITGPGLRLRSFIKWADTSGYDDLLGIQPATIYLGDSIDASALAAQIPHDSNYTVNILDSESGVADWTWWADQYMFKNHLDLVNTDWVADFKDDTQQLVITFADGTKESFTPENYHPGANYIYALYSLTQGNTPGEVVPGNPVLIGSDEPFPSTTGWDTNSYSAKNTDVTLNKKVTVVKSYSDGRPDETSTGTSTSTDTYLKIDGEYEKTEFAGRVDTADGQQIHNTRSVMHQNQAGVITDAEPVVDTQTEEVDGVTVTTTTTTEQQVLKVQRSYQVDTQDIITSAFYGSQVFLYQFGTGNSVLDGMFSPTESSNMFAPFIPVRIDNDMITDNRFADYFPMVQKAYKKATNAKFDKIIEKVKDNKSLGDIDYAYVVFGTSLNVKEDACRKYMYKFFQTMLQTSTGVTTAYGEYKTQMAKATASVDAWNVWLAAQNDPSNSLYGTPEPTRIPYPTLPVSSIQIKGNSLMNYNMTISWSAMAETIGTGMHDANHKVGDCWFVINADDEYTQSIYTGGGEAPETTFSVDHVTLYWQETKNRWRAMNIWGLYHNNKIYGGKSVGISAKDALNDSEESGFIIPINRDIYSAISLVDATQMSTACMFMVFNCYKVVKQKWYQTGFFKVVLVIVIIIISIYTGGAAAGLLGTAASVGAAVGLTGIAAIIVGTITNALAAMILMKLIGVVAVKAFGEKVGVMVGAIAAVIAVAVGSSLSSGGTVSAGFSSMTNADNLMKLTVAAGNGYSEYMQAAVQQTVAETQSVLDKYNEQSKQIAQQYSDLVGTDRGVIDPTSLTNATQHIYENMDSFISRTLMTGADIADLSISMLENFVDMTTSVDLTI
ncbi:hypothetical protein [Erwinia phage phiEaP8]|uniref:Uncharacterized protein n=1 Tax=Erwinia phage phiEaP8 TaxID=2178928 RepID=A0A3G1QTM0_9CAUD|nr:hypothetical protein HYP64_gp18 [Erwinia phage phiEaP8]AWN06207.1 hypothetical protein [Erwinia phage phiEaP8]